MAKVKTYLIIGAVLFVIASVITVNVQNIIIKKRNAEIERISHNYKVVQDSVKYITGENGLLASRIESQELTVKELKTYYQNLVVDIKDMKIQLRKVTGITAFNTETTNNINTFFRDSLRIDTIGLETLSYSDKWFDINIVKEGLKANINAVSRDSIIQVVHWQRSGKFWLTRFLTEKVFYQDIKSMNTNSIIKYPKWIIPIRK
jgi:hypothetical protein